MKANECLIRFCYYFGEQRKAFNREIKENNNEFKNRFGFWKQAVIWYFLMLLRQISNTFREKSIVDAMLLKIEKYSNNLEELVEERTIKLEEERKRAEDLIYRMLPKYCSVHRLANHRISDTFSLQKVSGRAPEERRCGTAREVRWCDHLLQRHHWVHYNRLLQRCVSSTWDPFRTTLISRLYSSTATWSDNNSERSVYGFRWPHPTVQCLQSGDHRRRLYGCVR